MNGDRMVIRKRVPGPDHVLDEHNMLRDTAACEAHAEYTGLVEPTCNCMPCWAFWYSTGLAITDTKIEQEHHES